MQEQIQKVLRELEEIRLKGNPRWNVDKKTGLLLNTLTRVSKAKLVLEIGTSNGYSGICFASALKKVDGKLITIESNVPRFNEAKENFERSGLSQNIEQVLGHAPEILEEKEIKGPFDIIFFDATKREHPSYLEAFKDSLRVGGLLITDNVVSHAKELEEFIGIVENSKDFQNSIIPIGTGLMLSLKLQ